MDNFRIDVTSVGGLTDVFRLLPYQSAVGYAVRGPDAAITGQTYEHQNKPAKPRRLVLFWSNDTTEDFRPLPAKMKLEDVARLVDVWLKEQDYGKQPDHDGDNAKGWRVYNEGWGRVDGSPYAFIAIAPAWAMYGQ